MESREEREARESRERRERAEQDKDLERAKLMLHIREVEERNRLERELKEREGGKAGA